MSAQVLSQTALVQRGASQRAFFTTRKPVAARALRMAARALSQDELKQQVRAEGLGWAQADRGGQPFFAPARPPHHLRAQPIQPNALALPDALDAQCPTAQAAWKAVEYVKSGMVVGLGTGSTAAFAVDRIGQLMKEGTLKDIVGVPTSIRTYEQAKSESLAGREGSAATAPAPASASAAHTCRPTCHAFPTPLLTSDTLLPAVPSLPSSLSSPSSAPGLGIPLATLDEQPKLDVAIDGADEVDPNLDVVKGRGGALLREKVRGPGWVAGRAARWLSGRRGGRLTG